MIKVQLATDEDIRRNQDYRSYNLVSSRTRSGGTRTTVLMWYRCCYGV
jgi:hypothetical protein